MNIKIGEKVVGSIYLNMQFSLSSFEGKSYATVLDMIKGSNGHTQQIFELAIGKFKIASFRRIYQDTEKLCVEGAELIAA